MGAAPITESPTHLRQVGHEVRCHALRQQHLPAGSSPSASNGPDGNVRCAARADSVLCQPVPGLAERRRTRSLLDPPDSGRRRAAAAAAPAPAIHGTRRLRSAVTEAPNPAGACSAAKLSSDSDHWRDQSIATLRDRLDVSRLVPGRSPSALRNLMTTCVSESSPTTTPGQTGRKQRVAAHDLPRSVRQVAENRHGLGLELHRLARSRELIQRGLDRPLADLQPLIAKRGGRFGADGHCVPPR